MPRIKTHGVFIRMEDDLFQATKEMARVFWGENMSMAVRELIREAIVRRDREAGEHPLDDRRIQ